MEPIGNPSHSVFEILLVLLRLKESCHSLCGVSSHAVGTVEGLGSPFLREPLDPRLPFLPESSC